MQTCEISDKGGNFENDCQKMLKAGLEFLTANPGSITPKPFPNEESLFESAANVRLRNLEAHLAKLFSAPEHDIKIPLVVGHLRYLSTHGKTKWVKEYTDNGKTDKIFDWDGTVNSIPKKP